MYVFVDSSEPQHSNKNNKKKACINTDMHD